MAWPSSSSPSSPAPPLALASAYYRSLPVALPARLLLLLLALLLALLPPPWHRYSAHAWSPVARDHRPDRPRSSTPPSAPPSVPSVDVGARVGGLTSSSSCCSSRRRALADTAGLIFGTAAAVGAARPPPALAGELGDATNLVDEERLLRNFRYGPDWTGTSLPLLSLKDAARLAASSSSEGNGNDVGPFPMGRWPDPMLRRPARPIAPSMFGTPDLRTVAAALRRTAKAEGAVGLAAQQCGVDGRMVWIDTAAAAAAEAEGGSGSIGKPAGSRARGSRSRGWGARQRGGGGTMAVTGEGTASSEGRVGDDGGLYLLNPRITVRSAEVDMKPWTERCLVLPPTFAATVLRDAAITVEYETLEGVTTSINLDGELARCVQHEMDHDRGVLILDHVGLDEMEGGIDGVMARIEGSGHGGRMAVAYGREIAEATVGIGSVVATGPGGARGEGRIRAREGWGLVEPASASDLIIPEGAESCPGLMGPPPQAGEELLQKSQQPQQQQQQAQQECDDACLAERKRIIEERRAMLRQSRSSTSREEVFELSRQRAKMYGTEYKGARCPEGVPCL